MNEFEGRERRRAIRKDLTTFCPTTFEFGGHTYHALMTDLSNLGAGFHLNGTPEDFFLSRNEEISYSVRTPYGESRCKGRTCWAKKDDEGYAWGTEFTQLSKNETDPLRSLMDSPF